MLQLQRLFLLLFLTGTLVFQVSELKAQEENAEPPKEEEVEAPYDGGRKFSFGVKGGLFQAKNFTWPIKGKVDAIMGYQAGGFFNIKLDKKGGAYLQIEALFSMKGSDINTPDTIAGIPGNNFEEVRLGYVNIPILLKVNLTQTAVHPYILVGPNIGFNILNKNKATHTTFATDDTPEVVKNSESELKGLRVLDAGFLVAGGVFMPLKNNFAITLEARFDLGITTILDTDAARNRSLGAMLGVSF